MLETLVKRKPCETTDPSSGETFRKEIYYRGRKLFCPHFAAAPIFLSILYNSIMMLYISAIDICQKLLSYGQKTYA